MFSAVEFAQVTLVGKSQLKIISFQNLEHWCWIPPFGLWKPLKFKICQSFFVAKSNTETRFRVR